jgi:hypothetical protein
LERSWQLARSPRCGIGDRGGEEEDYAAAGRRAGFIRRGEMGGGKEDSRDGTQACARFEIWCEMVLVFGRGGGRGMGRQVERVA